MSAKNSETIEKIFAAAVELLGEKGYAGATMDEIIVQAGVSKGAVYWHFKSKRDLFIELFVRWLEEFAKSYRSILESDASPKSKIKDLIQISSRFFEDYPDQVNVYLEFMNLAIKDRGFVERLLTIFEDYKIRVKKIIEEGIQIGEFGPVDPDRCAELLITSLDGLFLRACIDPSFQLDEALEFFSAFIFRAFGCDDEEAKK